MPQFILLAISGIVVGILSGLLGVGGGFILVPLLVYFSELSMHQAIGTSLAVIIPTALCAGFVHFQHGNISLKIVAGLVLFTVIGSFIGAYFANHIPAAVLKKIFAVFLAIMAIKMFISN
jgi:uncharacterized membrane protein YfcA